MKLAKPSTEGLTRQALHNCAQLVTRPGWHGEYHAGHRKCIAAAKRAEAKLRDEKTRPERRRAAREGIALAEQVTEVAAGAA